MTAEELDTRLREIMGEAADLVLEQLAPVVDDLVRARLLAAVEQLAGGAPVASSPRKKRATATKRATTRGAAKVPTCSSCGGTGHNKRSCGRANGVVDDDDQDEHEHEDPPPASIASPPPSSRSDRFARIEAAARARRGAA